VLEILQAQCAPGLMNTAATNTYHGDAEARRNKKSDANDAANEREYYFKKQYLWTAAGTWRRQRSWP